MSGRPVRHIIDDVNHDDLIGAPGGGVPEAPSDDTAFGRQNRAWTRVLPLGGGQLDGALNLPNGTLGAPSLAFGAADGTGISRAGAALLLGVGNQPSMALFPLGGQLYGPLNMLGNRVTQLGDATAAADALNLRTGDLRYAPGLGPWLVFEADAGWTTTLRYRTLPGGMQIDGTATGALTADGIARIGVLPPGYRPTRQQMLPGTVQVGLNYGWGWLRIDPNGDVMTRWSIAGAGSLIAVCGVLALD